MSDLVIRRNLYPNPMTMPMRLSAESSSTGFSVADGVATITAVSGSKPYAFFVMDGLTPGMGLTFHCTLEYLGDWPDNGITVTFFRKDWTTFHKDWLKRDGTDVTVSFTVPSDGFLHFRFYPRGDGLKVSGINIESTATFDETLPHFHGDTMPLPERG